MEDKKKFGIIIGAFLAAYFMPITNPVFRNGILEAFALLNEYAREHVLLCLIPAFFIAGAVAVFVSQGSVIKYLGATAKKWVSYTVASVSGVVLAVCSCTVLPLFAGIYMKGAGLGPAIAFLYSGPAINVLAITITARVLGLELAVARTIGAIAFSIVIGILMHLIFKKEETERMNIKSNEFFTEDAKTKPMGQIIMYFLSMVAVLVFANWAKPTNNSAIWNTIYSLKWILSSMFLTIVIYAALKWFSKEEREAWFQETWGFAQKILPLLFAGILISGILLGRPGNEGVIPSEWIVRLLGGNSLRANLFASVAGAFMYFATLTEVPILEGLIGAGMGKGPSLALLLAGPALSLPNMLVIRSIIGTKKTVVFVLLVIVMATATGMIYGGLSPFLP
ncbi:permease [Alkaliphilus pronyensis]|uniref:Permease n=1 Tax=Alkaliphilus pronyensis TaxID=1482732 RepID=A0A6I0F8D9_9FIRM|nr:permease [Alkaliphilus pronyensis]KAB3531895.1 permease [Alkaliphilus pronyensis]